MAAVRALAGELGKHLKVLSSLLDVTVSQRGGILYLRPKSDEPVDKGCIEFAERVLGELYSLCRDGYPLRSSDVRHGVMLLRNNPEVSIAEVFKEVVHMTVDKRPISPRTAGQREYLRTLNTHDVVMSIGPAGTGKTYLAMAVAVAAYFRGDVERIILTRPAVEAGEKLGFLPGDLIDKVDPYLRPLYDALADMIPADRVARMLERQIIEVAPLAFMRGRTLSQAYVILDEAQNATREQMRMFLTRLGDGSRMIINGDITQIDLPPRMTSGLVEALHVLRDVSSVGICELTVQDVVRHPLVSDIIEAYERNMPGQSDRHRDSRGEPKVLRPAVVQRKGSKPREAS
jgi:phosphate starvation-inducible PhoH-like protein